MMKTEHPIILLEGFRILIKPGIRRYVILPLLANLLLFTGLIYGAWQLAVHSQQQLENWLPQWLNFASWLIWPVMALMALLLLIYGFTALGNLIAAPFNAFLSETVERQYGLISEDDSMSLSRMLASIPASLWRECQKLLYSIPWLILAFILSFIPLLNLLGLLISAWLLAIQYLDYPADNHRIRFRSALALIRQKRLSAAGFGATVFLASMVPLVNILTMPAAVCSATLLWHRSGMQQAANALKAQTE